MNYKVLENTYDNLESSNITVIDAPYLAEKKSIIYVSEEDKCWIGINHSLIKSLREELCILEEEKAHYEVGIIPCDYTSN